MHPSPRRAALALLAGLLALGQARAAPIALAVNEWCPYSCALADGRRGLLLDIVSALFAAEGQAVRFVAMPLSRGVESARAGAVAGVVGVVPALAPELVYPSAALIDTQFCFFTRADSAWRFEGLDHSYGRLALGAAHGKALDARLGRAFANLARVSGAAVTLRMARMLELGRLDAFVEDRRSVHYVLATAHLPAPREAGCMEKKFEYVAFAPAGGDARGYAEMFARGMEKLRDSGQLARIVAGYAGGR